MVETIKNKLTSNFAALASAAVVFIFYYLVSFPYPDWLDSPEFAASAHRIGIFHPPGSPLAILVGHLISYLPSSESAYPLMMFSPIFAAASVFVMFRIVEVIFDSYELPTSNLAKKIFVSALVISAGLSIGIWNQAARCEVYTFALFLSTLVLQQYINYFYAKRSDIYLIRIALITGLSFCVHPLIGLASSSGTLFIFVVNWKEIPWKLTGPKMIVAGLVGMIPLFLLPLFATTPTDYRWGDIDSIAGWIDFVRGTAFANTFTVTGSQSLSERITQTLILFHDAFGISTLVAFLIGSYILVRTKLKLISTFWVVTATTSLTLVSQKQVFITNPDSTGYLLVFGPIALITIVVAGFEVYKLSKNKQTLAKIIGALIVLSLTQIYLNVQQKMMINGRNCNSGRVFAIEQMNLAPKNAVMLISDFGLVFMLEYLQTAEYLRPDLTVLYTKDLKNQSAEDILRERYPNRIVGSLPKIKNEKLVFPEEIPTTPVIFDAGPFIKKMPLEHMSPSGMLWAWGPPSLIDSPMETDLIFAKFSNQCEDKKTIDHRFASILAWHGYWSGIVAKSSGREERATALLSTAFCSTPDDQKIKTLMQNWNLEAPNCEEFEALLSSKKIPSQTFRKVQPASFAVLIFLLIWLGLIQYIAKEKKLEET